MQQTPIIREIASAVAAYHDCRNRGNVEWEGRWIKRLMWIASNLLPSGSGIDAGTKIIVSRSTDDKIVMAVAFHHMGEDGGYSGWTRHEVTARPSFLNTVEFTISGRDRNAIKDYLHEVYHSALTSPFPGYPDHL